MIEEFIKHNAKRLGDQVQIAPDISNKSLNRCTQYISPEAEPAYILLFADASLWGEKGGRLFGGGSIGFAFTGTHFYFANDKNSPTYVPLAQITHVCYRQKNATKKDTLFQVGDVFELITKNGTFVLDHALVGFDCVALQYILTGIIELIAKGSVPQKTKQNMSLAQCDDETKLLYLKLLCNYAYIGDSMIDSMEYATIQKILVRIELRSESRNQLRAYMADIKNKEKSGDLLYKLRHGMEFGAFYIAKFSMMQDALMLHQVTSPEQPWTEDGFLGSLLKQFNFTMDQVDLMLDAVLLHQDMVAPGADLPTLERDMKEVEKQAQMLNIPLVTLYCSGSPYTLDTFGKIFYSQKKTRVSVEKQQELMLQAVVKNTQETVNHLTRDINAVAQQLLEEMQANVQTKERMKKLAIMLSRLSAGATATSKQGEDAKHRVLLTSLPNVLDQRRLEQCNKKHSYEVEYRQVLNCYPINPNTGELTRKKDMTSGELEHLHQILQDMEYLSSPGGMHNG